MANPWIEFEISNTTIEVEDWVLPGDVKGWALTAVKISPEAISSLARHILKVLTPCFVVCDASSMTFKKLQACNCDAPDDLKDRAHACCRPCSLCGQHIGSVDLGVSEGMTIDLRAACRSDDKGLTWHFEYLDRDSGPHVCLGSGCRGQRLRPIGLLFCCNGCRGEKRCTRWCEENGIHFGNIGRTVSVYHIVLSHPPDGVSYYDIVLPAILSSQPAEGETADHS